MTQMDTLKDQIRNEILRGMTLKNFCEIKYGNNTKKLDGEFRSLLLDLRVEEVKTRFLEKVKKKFFDKNQDHVVILNEKINIDDVYKKLNVDEIREDHAYEISWYSPMDELIMIMGYSKTFDRYQMIDGVAILDFVKR